jgi:hypothetical protein
MWEYFRIGPPLIVQFVRGADDFERWCSLCCLQFREVTTIHKNSNDVYFHSEFFSLSKLYIVMSSGFQYIILIDKRLIFAILPYHCSYSSYEMKTKHMHLHPYKIRSMCEPRERDAKCSECTGGLEMRLLPMNKIWHHIFYRWGMV